MKRIGVTQRVEIVKEYNERRDCLDQRWADFLFNLGYIAVPLPNVMPARVSSLVKALQLDAVLLSGGNSIARLNPTAVDAAPERDAFEETLLSVVSEEPLPIIGVCRGMQMINLYYGGGVTKLSNHVATRHQLITQSDSYVMPRQVNSYHHWGIPPDALSSQLRSLACDTEGLIESFDSKTQRLLGIMWHPEREMPYSNIDLNLFKAFLK